MKKTLMILLSLMLTMPMMAQYRRPYARPSRPHFSRPVAVVRSDRYYNPVDIYVGIRVGGALATMISDDSYFDDNKMRAGVNAGMVIGFQMAPQLPLYFETGLLYVEKGGKNDSHGNDYSYSLNYLEMPMVLKFDCEVGDDMSIQPFFGGYVAAGVSGKIKDFRNRQAYSSYDDEGFKRFDAGLRMGCGFQFDHLYAEVGYDLGLANVGRKYFDTTRTGLLFATLGVNF